MHLEKESWGPGPKHGANTANVKALYRLCRAARLSRRAGGRLERGLERRLVRQRQGFQLHQAYPDFDIEELVPLRPRQGRRLVGHHETPATSPFTNPSSTAAFDLYKRLGIDAVKTGYVADMGGLQVRGPDGKIRFEWHEGRKPRGIT
jgi:alpha-glucosidase